MNLKKNIFALLNHNYDLNFKEMENIEAFLIYNVIMRKLKKKDSFIKTKGFCYTLYKNSL